MRAMNLTGQKFGRLTAIKIVPTEDGKIAWLCRCTPANCRWATRKEQNRNTRGNRWVTINGETKTLSEWLECAAVKANTFRERLTRGMTVEEALFTPRLSNVGKPLRTQN